MNALERLIARNNLEEVKTMNLLTGYQIISDNCVKAEDVADTDALRAVAFLVHGKASPFSE